MPYRKKLTSLNSDGSHLISRTVRNGIAVDNVQAVIVVCPVCGFLQPFYVGYSQYGRTPVDCLDDKPEFVMKGEKWVHQKFHCERRKKLLKI